MRGQNKDMSSGKQRKLKRKKSKRMGSWINDAYLDVMKTSLRRNFFGKFFSNSKNKKRKIKKGYRSHPEAVAVKFRSIESLFQGHGLVDE
jgi:hypothetical protein